MSAKAVKLRDVLEVQNGFAFKTEFFHATDGVPLIRIRDLDSDTTDTHYTGEFRDEFVVSTGDLLIGMDGNFHCRRWAGKKALLNQRVCRLRNFSPDVLPEYVFFGMQPKLNAIEASTAFATVKHISARQILDIELPLPPISEQRRIVDILSRAEGIVRLRREAEKKAAELIPALFLDMFGDPATNPKKWDRLRLEDVCEISYGIADKLNTSITSEQGVRILTISNVLLEGIIDPTVERYCLAADDKIKKCSVQRGDLLFNWRNGSESHIGKTAIWESDERVLHVSFLLRLRPNVEKLNSHFLWSMINLMRAMGFFIGVSRQQINRKFNASELSALELPIPPKELQDQFTHKIEQVRSIQSQQTAASAKARTTFDALLAQAFRA